MTTDNTKQNPTVEVKPGSETGLNDETLEEISGGAGPRFGFPRKRVKGPAIPDEPKEGGATVSW